MTNQSQEILDIARRVGDFMISVLQRQGLNPCLTPDQSLASTGIVDSLFMIDLILFLESEFGLDFSKDVINPLDVDSVNQISLLVQKRSTPAVRAPQPAT